MLREGRVLTRLAPPTSVAPRVKALTIIVVEDDDALRTFYQLALMEHRHAVNAVANGAEALRVVSSDIDLVVTDLRMPVMPGGKLIAELRARPEFREVPVLIVTAHPDDLRPELRDENTVVLRKPFDLDDFIRWVDAAAALRRFDN